MFKSCHSGWDYRLTLLRKLSCKLYQVLFIANFVFLFVFDNQKLEADQFQSSETTKGNITCRCRCLDNEVLRELHKKFHYHWVGITSEERWVYPHYVKSHSLLIQKIKNPIFYL